MTRAQNSLLGVALFAAFLRTLAACGGDDASAVSDGGADATHPFGDAGAIDGSSRDGTTVDATQDAVAETSPVDTSVADSSVPDTSVPDTNVPDTNVPDTNVPDTNVPDTDVPDTSDGAIPDDADAADTSVFDAGAPSLRFVHVAPTAAAFDVCITKVGDAPATVPYFRSQGFTSGVAFGEISAFFAFDPNGFYDLTYLPATATTCVPPYFGFNGNLSISGPLTVALYNTQITPVPGYNGAFFGAAATPPSAVSHVRFLHASNAAGTLDVYASANSGAAALWFSSLTFGGTTILQGTPAGTVSFDVRTSGTSTSVLTTSALSVDANVSYEAFLYRQAGTAPGFLWCSDTPPSPGTLTRACQGP